MLLSRTRCFSFHTVLQGWTETPGDNLALNEQKAAAALYLHQYIVLHCGTGALGHEGRVYEVKKWWWGTFLPYLFFKAPWCIDNEEFPYH